MRRHLYVLIAVSLLLSQSVLAQRRDKENANVVQSLEMRIDPRNLAPLVLGEKIRLVMHDGAYAEGRVVRASEAALTLRFGKSEPRNRFPRPEAELPLSGISVVQLKKGGNLAVPVTLGILGGIGGFALGAVAGVSCCDEHLGMILIPMGTSIAGAVGGSLLGREIVRKTITIYLNRRDPIVP